MLYKNNITKITDQLLVWAFFRYHALPLIIVYFIMFGTVNGNVLLSYHAGLMKGIVANPIMLLVTCIVWLVYTAQVLYFIKNKLHDKENFCLLWLNALPKARLNYLLLKIVAICLLPISSYALATAIFGFVKGYIYSSAIIVLIVAAIHLAGKHFINIFLINTELKFKWFVISHANYIKIYWPSILYFKYLFSMQWLWLLLQKMLSLMAIVIVFYSRKPDDEIRLPIVLYGLSLIMCTNFINQLIYWYETAFVHHRLMPTKFINKLGSLFLFTVLFFLLEFILFFKTAPMHSDYNTAFALMVFSVAFLWAIVGLVYACNAVLKNVYPYTGFFMIIVYFGALADSIWLISLLLFAIGLVLYLTQYTLFEVKPNIMETT